MRWGKAGATTSMSAPVPVAISRAGPLKVSGEGSSERRALRMGIRLRMVLGWCCNGGNWDTGSLDDRRRNRKKAATKARDAAAAIRGGGDFEWNM